MSKRILVVDDEPDLLKVLVASLRPLQFEVTTANNGEEAQNIILKSKFDLVITDVLMPKMDGFALYKEIKSHDKTKDIPVIVLTARGKMEDTFRISGVDDFIAKPFDTSVLLEKVQRVLQRAVSAAPKPQVEAPQGPRKTILIYCKDLDVNKEILSQFPPSQFLVVTSSIPEKIFDLSKNLSPSLITLQMDLTDEDFLVDVVGKLHKALTGVPIVTFTPPVSANAFSSNAVDLDNLLLRLKDKGVAKHLGPYSRLNFADKIKALLSK